MNGKLLALGSWAFLGIALAVLWVGNIAGTDLGMPFWGLFIISNIYTAAWLLAGRSEPSVGRSER
jgi:hypothetical protein